MRPLIEDTLRKLGAPAIGIIDTGQAVSRQLARLIDAAGLRRVPDVIAGTDAGTGVGTGANTGTGALSAYTTAGASSLQTAFSKLLQLTPAVTAVAPQAPGVNMA